MEDKSTRHAISIVIQNENDEILFALRSANKSSYPLAWSLPSHYVSENESPKDTVKRIGKNKLGIELEIGELLNEGKSDRGDFILFMHDYSATITNGEPNIVSNDYVELIWAEPHSQLNSMKVMGDCCRLYKEYLGSN